MSKYLTFLSFLYFVQGIPYGLQSRFLPAYFRTHGMSLTNVGFFKLLLTPWMLKALWAPLVDRHGTKKLWLVWSMVGLMLTCFVAAFLDSGRLLYLAGVLLMFNLLTSTQDIAVDGVAIGILSSSELGYGNIAQVVGYKFGAIFGGGLLTSVIDYISWTLVFQYLAFVYGVAVLVIYSFLPNKLQKITKNKSKDDKYQQSEQTSDIKTSSEGGWLRTHLTDVLNTEDTWWIIIYVLIYKLGEQGTLSMTPLFLMDNGVSTSVLGFWLGIVGQTVSICGSVVGGWLFSYKKVPIIQSLNSTQNARIVLLSCQCFLVVFWQSLAGFWGSNVNLGLAVLFMSVLLLISGTITTLTFTLMMQCSQRAPSNVQATHYTTLATFEVLGKLTFSVVTGALTDLFGYKLMFLLFLMLTMCVSPFLSTMKPQLTIPIKNNVIDGYNTS
ncbi:major facilitator superfamily domain-containing protein 3 [Patella vulgata]|uniref:major facilitator superfamily domain-containing protein 3 n=1 Tax=Patella vulgata TaxID=6465 RepID=UPI002180004F|nr:major facilitator superfamily domain-containing protein 3 [Patella vulgata]